MTPDQNAEAARHALDVGDLEGAVPGVAGALSADPRSDGYIDLLRRLLTAAGNEPAERLFRDLDTPAGLACVAWIRASSNQADAALELLSAAALGAPASGYLRWLTTWARDEGWSPASINALTLAVEALAPHERLLGKPQMRALARAVERRAARLTITPAPLALAAAEAWLAAGEPAKATAWAGDAHETSHGYRSALVYGRALAGAGRMESAERVFRVALTARPDDIDVRLAWGIAAIEQGDGQTAQHLFAAVVERRPNHPRALAGLAYSRWLTRKTATHWLALHHCARQALGDTLVQQWDMNATPWRNQIEPFEPQQDALEVSGEPRWGLYERGQPALPTPPDSIIDLVVELAETRYASPAWLVAGRDIGQRAGASATRDLLAVGLFPMVSDELLMAQRLAAMFAVAGRPGAWEGSERQAAFESVFATNDIALRIAAAAALAELGHAGASADVHPDIVRWLTPLAARAPHSLRRAAAYALVRLSPETGTAMVESLDTATLQR